MRVLIIGNPIAGRGRARRLIDDLIARLERHGHDVRALLTTGKGDARRWAGQVPGEVQRLVVVGGDGTLNEVINGLADPSRFPLTQLPLGTANIIARELNLPWDPAGVADVVTHGVIRPMDLGVMGSRRFIALASAGFDALVTRDIYENRRGSLGFRGYIRPVLRTLRRYRPPLLRVRVDDLPPATGAMVVVSNIRNYAGFFRITDQARCDSGFLDVAILHDGRIANLASCALSAFRGSLSRRSDVTMLRGRHIELDSDLPVPVQVDGDYVRTTPAVIDILPAALPFVTRSGNHS